MSDLTVGEVMQRAAALRGRKKVTNQFGTFPLHATEKQRVNANRKASREYQRRLRGDMTTVACPKCHTERRVQERQALRIEAGVYTGLCRLCRYPNAVPAHEWMTPEERETPAQTFLRLSPEQKQALRTLAPMDDERQAA